MEKTDDDKSWDISQILETGKLVLMKITVLNY
jgi:hypothetical protein